jgi:ribonuclease P/MRP protein subunit RPP40
VTVDTALGFNDHVAAAVKKGNQIAGVIRRSFTHLPPKTFSQLFRALVRPHLEYAHAVWQPYTRMHIDAIERVQRRATKRVQGLQDQEYPERLRRLGLPTLAFRRLRGDMIEVYKMLHNIYDQSVGKEIIRIAEDLRTRGHSLKLQKPRARKNVRQHFFGLRVINPWNALPDTVVTAPSVHAFENRLDKHWARHPLRYDPVPN